MMLLEQVATETIMNNSCSEKLVASSVPEILTKC